MNAQGDSTAGKTDDFFRRLADSAPVYLWVRSASGENIYINRACAKFLGIDGDSLGYTTPDYVHPEDRQRWIASVDDHVRRRIDFSGTFRFRRHDGVYRWALVCGSPQFSPEGEYLGFFGAAFDITEQRRAQDEIAALSERLIRAQEEERARIARELHDDLSQRIASLSISISHLKKQIPKQASGALAQADRLHGKLTAMARSVRAISHQLHPAVLDHAGLAAAVRSYCQEFSALNKLEVRFEANAGFEEMPPATALSIYRIVQEALQNVAKHSGAARAEVRLIRSSGAVDLSVKDSGRGMASASGASGLGLVSMKERARLAGGSLEIESAPGKGTELRVSIPAPPRANQN